MFFSIDFVLLYLNLIVLYCKALINLYNHLRCWFSDSWELIRAASSIIIITMILIYPFFYKKNIYACFYNWNYLDEYQLPKITKKRCFLLQSIITIYLVTLLFKSTVSNIEIDNSRGWSNLRMKSVLPLNVLTRILLSVIHTDFTMILQHKGETFGIFFGHVFINIYPTSFRSTFFTSCSYYRI